MSVASLVHGKAGISWPKDMLGVSLHFDCEYFRHSWQFSTNFPSWSFKPGQYTVSFACSLHFVNPRWPSWINFSISACLWLGITVLVPFSIRPSSIVISSLNVQNACILLGSSFMLLSHPICIVYLSMTWVSSACVASYNCCKLSFIALSWLVIWYTLSLGSLIESWSPPTLDKQSASCFLGLEGNAHWNCREMFWWVSFPIWV